MTDSERLQMIHDGYQDLIMQAFSASGITKYDYEAFVTLVEIALAGKIHLVFEDEDER